jgi:hypothetical protein
MIRLSLTLLRCDYLDSVAKMIKQQVSMKRFLLLMSIGCVMPAYGISQDFQGAFDSLAHHNGADSQFHRLLNDWEKCDPNSADLAYCRLHYYFTKSSTPLAPLQEGSAQPGFGRNLIEVSNGKVIAYVAYGYRYDDSLMKLALDAVEAGIRHHPERFDLYYAKARVLASAGRMAECESLLLGVLDRMRDGQQVWRGDDNTPINRQEVKQYVIRLLKSYQVCRPPSLETVLHVAEKLVALFPSDTASLACAAEINDKLAVTGFTGNPAQAKEVASKAIVLYQKLVSFHPPDELLIKFTIASLAARQGDYKTAMLYYDLVQAEANRSLRPERRLSARARNACRLAKRLKRFP